MTLAGMLADGISAALALPLEMVSRETEANHSRSTWGGLPAAGQHHLICKADGQSVCCLSPDATGPPYMLDLAIIAAGVTAHVRQCHADMIPVT